MPGIVQGESSCEISSYKLPVCNTDEEKRNFPGYETHALAEAVMNDISQGGTTESRGGGGMHGASKGEVRSLKRNFK